MSKALVTGGAAEESSKAVGGDEVRPLEPAMLERYTYMPPEN